MHGVSECLTGRNGCTYTHRLHLLGLSHREGCAGGRYEGAVIDYTVAPDCAAATAVHRGFPSWDRRFAAIEAAEDIEAGLVRAVSVSFPCGTVRLRMYPDNFHTGNSVLTRDSH